MRIVMFIFISLLSCNCNSQEFQDAMPSCDLVYETENTVSVIDDVFISDFLNTYLSWSVVQEKLKGMQVEKRQVQSPHSSSAVNYIVTAKNEEDDLSYYLSNDNSFPLCVSIKTGRFDLPHGIHMGQDINFFSKKFPVHNTVGVIKVESLEGNNFIKFYFSKGKLVTIAYKSDYWD